MKDVFSIIERRSMTPPVDIFGIALDLGLRVYRRTLPANHSARIIKSPDGRYTVDLNISDPETRQRFSLAHEIAHFLYHRDLIGDGVSDSPAFRSPDMSVYENTPLEQHHEVQANRFAANILMPKHLVANAERRHGRNIPAMARELKVSVPAMRIRMGLPPNPSAQEEFFFAE